MEKRQPAPARGAAKDPQRPAADLAVGRNAVLELLKGKREVECVYLCEEDPSKGQPLSRIAGLARERGVPVKRVDVRKLEHLAGGLHHQGVVAVAAAFAYSTLEEILDRAGQEPPFLVLADGIEDPHNLGAIIRTAEAAGAHGLVIPKRGGVGLTPIVGRTSAGAVEHLPVARVPNLTAAIQQLQKRGIWVYCADMGGQPWDRADLRGPLALVVGSEGFGVSRLVRETCDGALSLPMLGRVNSLNASVAAGILLYAAVRQRMGAALL